MKYFRFKAAYLNEGWLSPALVGVDSQGIIQYLSDKEPFDNDSIEDVDGFAIPGFQNGHSHAFQYAMSGIAERHDGTANPDDFWTWRDAMYKVALGIDPDQMEAIAAMLYAEMLRMGYTAVAEFHYVHHDKDGKHYWNKAELGERLIAAAQKTGIKITLIPVFYQKGGFGIPPIEGQKRFISKNPDEYGQLLESTKKAVLHYQNADWAISVHSLRAAEPNLIPTIFQLAEKDTPIHMHIAEQLKEVEDCLDYLKRRPVEWVLENLDLNENYFFIHATHLNTKEVELLAKSKANVVLCPSTEGNLGDGRFRLEEFQRYGGNWTIGTDSQINLNPLEDLRLLDYGQRIHTHKRNTFYSTKQNDCGAYAVERSIITGRKSVKNIHSRFFGVGQPLDALVIDAMHPLVMCTSLPFLLSTIVYCSDTSMNLGTIVNGGWKIKKHDNPLDSTILMDFKKSISTLGIRQK